MSINDIAHPASGVNVTSQTATDDLGDPSTPYTAPQYGVHSFGYHAVGPTSASSLSKRTLSASFTWTTSDPIAPAGGGVGYTLYPVRIILSGTTQDSSGSGGILVGQGCKASLSGVPQNCTVSNYQWSVSGSTFQDWQSASSSNSQASFYDPGPGTQTNPTYHWFWNDFGPGPTSETVTCTAMVTPPTGQGSSFSVTATQNVAVYVPTLSALDNKVGMGYIRNTQQNNVTNSQMIALQPGNPPAGNGSIWTAAVSLPSIFGTGGKWAYVQLIKAGEYLASPSQKATSKDTLMGEGLDTSFPYSGHFFSPDGRKDTDGDAPYISGLNITIKNVVMTSSFHTYLMFQPPANSSNDVRWVPLAESLWTTNFNASLDPYNNSRYSAWTDYSADQSVGQVGLGYNFVPQNSFPSWTQIIDASDDPYITQ